MGIETQLGWTVVCLPPSRHGIRHQRHLRGYENPDLQALLVGQEDLFLGHLVVPCLSALVGVWSLWPFRVVERGG